MYHCGLAGIPVMVHGKGTCKTLLKEMNESPTSISVVAETLKRSQKVAEECNKNSILVTYDLALLK